MKRLIPLLLLVFSSPAKAEEKMFAVPVTEAGGNVRMMQTRVCYPLSAGKRARVVVINHGSPASAADRPGVAGYACSSEPAQWFLSRGYLVVSPIRRGYGATGGSWSEAFGSCDNADFVHGGLETARDIQAAVDFVTGLPEALPDRVVIVGQSAGGWGSIAFDSLPHPKVAALINMAGGRGGHKGGQSNQNCSPDALVKAAGQLGATATTPMLWMYAENDSFFSPALASALFSSFSAAGGRAEFVRAPAFGNDGHSEFGGSGGSKVWGPYFERYLSERLGN